MIYRLPAPLVLDATPRRKSKFMVRSHITDYWELKLRSEAPDLDSLAYFKPQYMYMSLTDQLARHWTTNKSVSCLLEGYFNAVGSLEHILLHYIVLSSP